MSIQYSVVIPAYNAAATIVEAIDSVMSQSIPPTEVIVVDDGSTDATASIVLEISGPLQLIQRVNGGPGAATTDGIRTVRTPMLATLDSDDLWISDKIERQVDYLAMHPQVTAAFTLARQFQGDHTSHTDGKAQRLWTRTTMLIATAAARSVGKIIDPPGGRGDMVDWLARCGEMGYALGMVDQVLALRRIRPDSLSYGRDAQRDAGYLHVVRRALERKRQQRAESKEGVCG